MKKLLQQDQNKRRSTNISKEEFKALRELKKDNNRLILTADKGVALVVINKADYIKKAEDLLKEDTYKRIPEDPTVKQKNKLINILKNIKTEGGLNEESYRRLYPTGAGSPKFYGLPKIHKPGIPLRPIISSIGTVTYNTAKELVKILKPLVGLSKHHVHNTRDFVEQLKEIRLKKEESMVSYDVTAHFTSVPIPPALKIIEEKLIQDKDLQQRTSMSIKHVIKLLDFCLRSTYFVFQGQYYEQVERCSNGVTTQPHSGQYIYIYIWSTLKEKKPLKQLHIPQVIGKGLWMTLLSFWNTEHKEEFFQQINAIEEKIQFTVENTRDWWINTLSGHLNNSLEVMEVCQPQYTENPPIPTNICSGTATMSLPINTVWLTHCYIEQRTSAPTKNN